MKRLLFLLLISTLGLSACVTHIDPLKEDKIAPQEFKPCRCARKIDNKYTIKNKSGLLKENPAWKPTKVYNDGVSVYITMPQGVVVRPVLYILDDKKNPWILPYQVNKHYFRVDCLFKKAMLIYQKEKVEITKK